jgi:hypothetical protein
MKFVYGKSKVPEERQAMMPGSISGNFIFQKMVAGLAPKSMAASTSE